MANKRISELTSITGANLADADLLVVVDVSDTTMAASGTNKKITMSELAKDSALTDNLIAKTTLTTDGDVLTRAAGAPARITRADLAQDSAFSSRYKPLASDTIWIPAQNLTAVFNTPSMGTLGNATYEDTRQPVMLFDASTTEYAATTWFTPPGWATYDLYLWWSNAGAGSGDVFWGTTVLDAIADTETTDSGSYLGDCLTAAPAQYIAKRTKLNGSARSVTVGEFNKIVVLRAGAAVSDTLGNDAGVIGLEVVRAS